MTAAVVCDDYVITMSHKHVERSDSFRRIWH